MYLTSNTRFFLPTSIQKSQNIMKMPYDKLIIAWKRRAIWDIFFSLFLFSYCTRASRSCNTRFFLYKHHRYKHREPQIWPKIKHHLSTSLSLTSLQHTNLVCVNYLNFPNFTVFVDSKIHQSDSFHTLNHSSFKIFKFLWLRCTIDEHKSY